MKGYHYLAMYYLMQGSVTLESTTSVLSHIKCKFQKKV